MTTPDGQRSRRRMPNRVSSGKSTRSGPPLSPCATSGSANSRTRMRGSRKSLSRILMQDHRGRASCSTPPASAAPRHPRARPPGRTPQHSHTATQSRSHAHRAQATAPSPRRSPPRGPAAGQRRPVSRQHRRSRGPAARPASPAAPPPARAPARSLPGWFERLWGLRAIEPSDMTAIPACGYVLMVWGDGASRTTAGSGPKHGWRLMRCNASTSGRRCPRRCPCRHRSRS